MEVPKDILVFLDLRFKFEKESKRISVDNFSKATNSFTYVVPSTCFPKNNIKNIPQGDVLRLRRICDSDSKFEKRYEEYQKYLIDIDYKLNKVKKQFSDVRNTSKEEARRPKTKSNFSTSCNLITQYNPMLPNIKTIFKRYLPVLHSKQEMLGIFPENTINVTYKRNKNLKELISPSLIPKIIRENNCSIDKCSRRCDICKKFSINFH